MRFCWLLLLIWVPTRPIQAQISISARVVSGVERRPVAYSAVGVAGQSRGTYADEQGRFTLDGLRPDDSFRVSSVGYRTRTVSVGEISKLSEISLDEVPVGLAEVPIRRTAGTLQRVGSQRSEDTRMSFGVTDTELNTEVALRLPGADSSVTFLTRVGFYVCERGLTRAVRAPFHVRVYTVLDSLPGPDLLTHSVVTAASRPDAWHEVDLRNFNIRVPRQGLYVAMEWLVGAHQKFFYTFQLRVNPADKSTWVDKRNYGQNLQLTPEFPHVMTAIRSFGGGWKPYDLRTFAWSDGKLYKAMIRAEYLVYE